MNCARVLDKVYEYSGESQVPLWTRIWIGMHLLVCPDCAQEVERFEVCKDILQNDFLPSVPADIEDKVMAMITTEEDESEVEQIVPSGGFSTRGWVIAGLVMLVSFATAFFGFDFNEVALAAGMSFMIPIGITIGIALTCYGALFIGSHLKELIERFDL
jgi:hypothetical protein